MVRKLFILLKCFSLALAASLFLSSCVVVADGPASANGVYSRMSGARYLLADPDGVPVYSRPSAASQSYYIYDPDIFIVERVVCSVRYSSYEDCRFIKQYGTTEYLYASVRFDSGDRGYIRLTYFDAAPYHRIISRSYARSRGMTVVEYKHYTIEHSYSYKKSYKSGHDRRVRAIKKFHWHKRIEKLVIKRQVSIGMTRLQVFWALNPEENDYFEGERLERIDDIESFEVWEGGGKAYYFSNNKLRKWEPYRRAKARARAEETKENKYIKEFKERERETKRLKRIESIKVKKERAAEAKEKRSVDRRERLEEKHQDRYEDRRERREALEEKHQDRYEDRQERKEALEEKHQDRYEDRQERKEDARERRVNRRSKRDELKEEKESKQKKVKKKKVVKKKKKAKKSLSKEFKKCVEEVGSEEECAKEEEKRKKKKTINRSKFKHIQ